MPKKIYTNIVGVIIITLHVVSCGGKNHQETQPTVVRPVKLITVGEAESTAVSRFPAVIGANRLSELSFQVGGKLQEFPVNEAQSLERGELIGKLDQRDFESAVVSAKAQYTNAEDEYRRALELSQQDLIARNTLEQRKTQRDVSKSQLDSAEKALEDSVLLAPFKGVVAQVMTKELQTVSPGQAIVKYMSSDTLEATIDLPASFLANIPKQETEDSHRQAFIILDAAPNRLIDATYKEASLLADTASQTYAITFEFSAPENMFVLPGMNATIELRIEDKSKISRVAVPLAAITSDGQNNYVWAVDKTSMEVSKRAVTIEDGVGSTVVVVDGLEANETIAGAGAAYLSEGMKIREWK